MFLIHLHVPTYSFLGNPVDIWGILKEKFQKMKFLNENKFKIVSLIEANLSHVAITFNFCLTEIVRRWVIFVVICPTCVFSLFLLYVLGLMAEPMTSKCCWLGLVTKVRCLSTFYLLVLVCPFSLEPCRVLRNFIGRTSKLKFVSINNI